MTATALPATKARSRTPLVGYLVAEAISLVGTRLSMIAIPWLVLVTTGRTYRGAALRQGTLPALALLAAGIGALGT